MELSDASEKIPATPGIDPGTFQLVAQCLNHYPGPKRNEYQRYILARKTGQYVGLYRDSFTFTFTFY
jgi:hypothetical protein